MNRKCWLRCLSNLHKPILLKNNENYVAGRTKDTRIKDKRCSRTQVEFVADYSRHEVRVRQVGANPSGVNGTALGFGNSAVVKHSDVVEILLGEYPHKIEFDPPPENSPSVATKRGLSPAPERPSKRACGGGGGWVTLFDNALLVRDKDMEPSAKIAGYDMDGTLIVTKSGKVFAENYDDWRIAFPEVPGKLKELHKNGYKIVIFTNQAGIARGKQTAEGMQRKIDNITARLGVPCQVMVSTGKGHYRKPCIGMWTFLADEANGGVEIDINKSFYVGDAAGRPAEGKKKKDFSTADRLFALNIGIKFNTPEEHFMGYKTQKFNMPDFDPRQVSSDTELFEPASTKVPKHKLEVIVLVGFPGSGKSFFAQNYLAEFGYVQANRDTIGSWQKCVSLMEKSLQNGKKVVVDNTNPDVESRKRYVDIANKMNVPIRCFVFNLSYDHCMHNNKFRELTGDDHAKVNSMVYNMYKSKYEEPQVSEGFDDVVKVNFVPKFRNSEEEKLYKMFLL